MSAPVLTTTESPQFLLRKINSLKAQMAAMDGKVSNTVARKAQMKTALSRLEAQYALCAPARSLAHALAAS